MASWETYDHSASRRYDDSYKPRRPRNDSTLDPDYHDFTHLRSPYPAVSLRSRSRAPKSRDHSQAPRSRPPAPYVEDEKQSLKREHNPKIPVYDPIPSRGTVDQDPVLVDAPGYIPDRRFVWVPSANKSPETHSTPPTSDDERARRLDKRRGPRLETVGLPEMRREASPYAWSKPTPSQTPARASGEYFLSPDAMTPPTTSRSAAFDRQPQSSIPARDWSEPNRRSQTLPPKDYPPPRSASQQMYEGLGTSEATRSADDYIPQRSSTRYSWTKPDQTHSSPTTPFYPPTTTPEIPRWRSGSSDGYPIDYPRKPAPPQVVNLQNSERTNSYPRHSSESSYDPNDTSPPSRTSSSDRLKDAYPATARSTPTSRPTSRGGSTHASPAPSPRIQHPSEYPWGTAFAATAAGAAATRRPQPPSRLAESTVPRSPRPQPSRSVSAQQLPLPYPDDDRSYETMPSERDHQYFPEQPSGLLPPFTDPVSRATTPKLTPMAARYPTSEERSATAGASRSNDPRNMDQRLDDKRNNDQTPKLERVPSVALPVCTRRKYTTKYKDWYTLEGCPGFDICSRCVKGVFDGTPYRGQFKPSPPRPSNMPSRCEFSNPWIRLAWLLTRTQRLPTLNMLTSIFAVDETEEPCPGMQKGVRNWYSVRDRDGHFLRGLTICSADVKKVEILFPAFKGLLLPLPMRMSHHNDIESLTHYCALRTYHNGRFSVYLDCLAALHDEAVSAHRMPDASDFVTLVRRKTRFPECPRDDKQVRCDWYFIPTLAPALTVCEECYNDVVLPHVQANSDVAMRFNRSMQTVRNEGRFGLSCQLYSTRMRDVFRYAVEDNDMKYLARKAKERKEIEDDFQDRVLRIREDSEQLKGRSGYAISSKAQQELMDMQNELDAIGEVWEDYE